jgi:hypothetical protein
MVNGRFYPSPKILDREIRGLIFKEVQLGDSIQPRIGANKGGYLG